jgi:hypothetical protein
MIIINSCLVTYALSWSCDLNEMISANALCTISTSSLAKSESAPDSSKLDLSENETQFPFGPYILDAALLMYY